MSHDIPKFGSTLKKRIKPKSYNETKMERAQFRETSLIISNTPLKLEQNNFEGKRYSAMSRKELPKILDEGAGSVAVETADSSHKRPKVKTFYDFCKDEPEVNKLPYL